MSLRWFKSRDMLHVLDIEEESFPEPWTEEDFHQMFQNKNCACMIFEDESKGGKPVGYMIFDYNKTAYKIINMAVDKNYRRCGVGRALIASLIEYMNEGPKGSIRASVSDRNLPAQLFLRDVGFKAKRISRDIFGPDHHSYDFVLVKEFAEKDKLCQEA